ncbi:hypothetical protein B296_00041777 [Ensete ventricosum]|uniref:Secreted protein n=1 Tax=Ensete ventricosum TaxID=4639 RepID=A0A426YY84_ENSVE|nr:hypothetical protein B296_00041777 [Ensete ventricosum]
MRASSASYWILTFLSHIKSLSCVAGWSSTQMVDGQSDCELWSLQPLILSHSWRRSAMHLPHQPPANESSGYYSSEQFKKAPFWANYDPRNASDV